MHRLHPRQLLTEILLILSNLQLRLLRLLPHLTQLPLRQLQLLTRLPQLCLQSLYLGALILLDPLHLLLKFLNLSVLGLDLLMH